MKLNTNTKAQNYENRLKYAIQAIKSSQDINYTKDELICVLEQLYTDFKAYYKQGREKIVQIDILEGNKGKGNLEIWKNVDNDVEVQETIAERDEYGNIIEVKKIRHVIPKENINNMLEIIKNLDLNQPYKCYYFATKLGYSDWKSLWKERKEYFLKYYFCVKIFQKLGLIKYQGSFITRVK